MKFINEQDDPWSAILSGLLDLVEDRFYALLVFAFVLGA
jgi:hypothetical protein